MGEFKIQEQEFQACEEKVSYGNQVGSLKQRSPSAERLSGPYCG